MIKPFYIKLTTAINLVISTIMVGDYHIAKRHVVKERFADISGKVDYVYASNHTDYFIHSASGKSYRVPVDVYLEMTGDTFYVLKTGFIGKSLKLIYPTKNGIHETKIGVLGDNNIGFILIYFALAISLINVLPFRIIRSENLNMQLLVPSSVMLISVLIMYVWRN